jgi:hypothetical protein
MNVNAFNAMLDHPFIHTEYSRKSQDTLGTPQVRFVSSTCFLDENAYQLRITEEFSGPRCVAEGLAW